MSELTELVDLPDPAVQPLVHPLDLREARRPYRISQLIAALCNPAVGLCIAGIVWFGSQNYVVPLIAGGAIVGFGVLAGRMCQEQAWAFIPRRRQDRQRPVPLGWELGSALVLGTVLALALLLVVFRLDQPDVSSEVRQFTFGMGASTGVLIVLDAVGRLLRGRGRSALFALPGLAAVLGCLAAAYAVLFDSSQAATSPTVVGGAVTMLVVGACVGGWTYLDGRRAAAHERGGNRGGQEG